MSIKYRYILLAVLFLAGLMGCSEYDAPEEELSGRHPISFDFHFADSSAQTRTSSLDGANIVVYVSRDKATWYPYTRGVTGRWECNTENPLTWTGKTMKLWAVVRNDNADMSSSTTTIVSDQATNGYDGSDFLACVGTYTFTTGTVKMTLEHKVAHLVVNVSNCYDASLMACETVEAFPTIGQIGVGPDDITLTGQTSSATSVIKLFRTSFDTSTNTARFEAYLLPQASLGTAFKLTCGTTSAITYTTAGLASGMKLEAGKTTQVNIGLQTIMGNAGVGVWEYEANGDLDQPQTGSCQTFIAPCAGRYKLEVWGAQGGSYTDLTYTKEFLGDPKIPDPDNEGAEIDNPAYVELSEFKDKKFTEYDNAKRGTKECVGGKGAYVTGVVTLEKGDVLYVYVGKAGSEKFIDRNKMAERPAGDNVTKTFYVYQMPGGWNGGATAIVRTNYGGIVKIGSVARNRNQFSGGGGGATDIALKGKDGNGKNLAWDSPEHLFSRIIVAGGGGGAMYYPGETGYYDGGYGGGGSLLGTSTWTGGEGDGYYTARGRGGSLSQGYDVRLYYCMIEANKTNLIKQSGITEKKTVDNVTTGDYDYDTYFEDAPLTPVFGKGGSCYWTNTAYEGVGAGGGGWYGGGGGSGWLSNGAGSGGSSYAWTDQVTYDGTPLCDFYKSISKYGFYKFDNDNGYGSPSNPYDGQIVPGGTGTPTVNGVVMTSKDYDSFMDYIDRKVNPEGQGGIIIEDGVRKTYTDANKTSTKRIKYFLTDVANQRGVREGNGFARITLLAE